MRKQDCCLNIYTIAFAILYKFINCLSSLPIDASCSGIYKWWKKQHIGEVNACFFHGKILFECTDILNWFIYLVSLPVEFRRSIFHFCQEDHKAGCTHSSLTPSHRARGNRSVSSLWAPVRHSLSHWFHLA